MPAHNEERVLARTLGPLAAHAARGALEVIVVCNACTDRSADVARGFAGVTVIETGTASKPHALNLGDAHATAWPRIYLDADIVAAPESIGDTAAALAEGAWLAARPQARFVTTGAGPIVRAYYRARSRVPSLNSAMWGAGVYALSEQGHRRLVSFPDVTGDDLWVDRLFTPAEKTVIGTTPVAVQVPRTLGALIAISRRNVAGAREPGPDSGQMHAPSRVVRELAGTVRSPLSAVDALVYVGVALCVRLTRSSARRWERDDTSRR
ncbi:glycosyltransferase [Microbacterium sp. OR21]|uniref:glycosyltransferase n=1 Tax=Microbacterium sp. OR21 TaxID=3095346 RepID=UPI0039B3BB96